MLHLFHRSFARHVPIAKTQLQPLQAGDVDAGFDWLQRAEHAGLSLDLNCMVYSILSYFWMIKLGHVVTIRLLILQLHIIHFRQKKSAGAIPGRCCSLGHSVWAFGS